MVDLKLFGVVALILFFIADQAQSEEPDRVTKIAMSGYLRTVLEFETDEISKEDLDISSYLNMDVLPLFNENLSFHFFGWAKYDLDTESEIDKALRRGDNRIFHCYLQISREGSAPFTFRLGRQWIHEVESTYVDGIRFDVSKLGPFDMMAFLGQNASVYSSTTGEFIFGGQINYQPWESTRIRLSGFRSDEGNPIVNDFLGFYLSQKIGTIGRFYYNQKFLNHRGRDIRVGGTLHIPNLELDLRGNYYKRINRSPVPGFDDIRARELSDYYLLLGEMAKQEVFELNAMKYLGKQLAVAAGFSLTHIQEEEDPFNRGSKHFFASLYFYDLFTKKLNLSFDTNFVTANLSRFSSEIFTDIDGSNETITTTIRQNDDSFFLTGEIEYAFTEDLTIAVGSAYGDFDFERAINTSQVVLDTVPLNLLISNSGESFITRTYFMKSDWKFARNWLLKFMAEFNSSKINTGKESDNYVRIFTSLTYRF